MKNIIMVVPLLIGLSGCLEATVPCPAYGPPIVMTANSPDATQVVAELAPVIASFATMGTAAVKERAVPAAVSTPRPVPPTNGSVTLKTIPFFGENSISCGPQGTSVTTVTPAS
jgi:hypothetical protein